MNHPIASREDAQREVTTEKPRRRRRRWPLLALAVVGVGLAAVWMMRPRAERAIQRRLLAEAQRRGLVASIERVHIGLHPLLELDGLTLTRPGRFRFVAEHLGVGLAPWGHTFRGPEWRIHAQRAWVALAGGVALQIEPAVWDVRRSRLGWEVWRRVSGETLQLAAETAGTERRLRVRGANVGLMGLAQVFWRGIPLVAGGRADVEMGLGRGASGALHVVGSGTVQGLQVASMQALEGFSGDDPVTSAPDVGAPTDATLSLALQAGPRPGTLEITRLRVTTSGATIWLGGSVAGGGTNPVVDLQLGVERIDFAQVLRTAGLDLPAQARALGSAELELAVRGRVRDPKSLVVTQKLDYEPPRVPLPAVTKLAGPFVHVARGSDGDMQKILVGPESPDFIAIEDVPPRFLRALLLAEDTSFYGHHGIDLAEVPVAMATDWVRGRAARGASTITQQLVKNLFLSREKSVSRKLQELALSLLVDDSLSKARILEIYLNIIEWGPRVFGLRPAARYYFGIEPEELSTKQMAFLVCMIPGPIKYQRSIATGVPSPAFERLMTNLLSKLLAVGEIDQEEYERAVAERLFIERGVPDSGEELDGNGAGGGGPGGGDDAERPDDEAPGSEPADLAPPEA